MRYVFCRYLALFLVSTRWLVYVHAFHNSDYIQASRKTQFGGQRTNWHDLVASACPRFGRDKLVAVDLPRPKGYEGSSEDLKIQLSFDGDRHQTQWLKIISKSGPHVPLVKVILRRSGEDLLGVIAEVHEAPMHIQHRDRAYVSQWKDDSAWPKQLLVHFKWDTHTDVDLDRGFAVLFIIGLVVCGIVGANAAMGAGPKLAQFIQEIAADLDTDVSAAPQLRLVTGDGRASNAEPSSLSSGSAHMNVWKGGGKAE